MMIATKIAQFLKLALILKLLTVIPANVSVILLSFDWFLKIGVNNYFPFYFKCYLTLHQFN